MCYSSLSDLGKTTAYLFSSDNIVAHLAAPKLVHWLTKSVVGDTGIEPGATARRTRQGAGFSDALCYSDDGVLFKKAASATTHSAASKDTSNTSTGMKPFLLCQEPDR